MLFLRHQVPVIEITPEQICIKFQFISSEFMNHEQFALLQSPRTCLIQECSLKWEKECKLISKKDVGTKEYVKQLDAAECDSLTLSWALRQIR